MKIEVEETKVIKKYTAYMDGAITDEGNNAKGGRHGKTTTMG
jgi:hypothetical protein